MSSVGAFFAASSDGRGCDGGVSGRANGHLAIDGKEEGKKQPADGGAIDGVVAPGVIRRGIFGSSRRRIFSDGRARAHSAIACSRTEAFPEEGNGAN